MSDDEVFELIGRELGRRLPSIDDLDAYVRGLQSLPAGLRAMAAIHQLDVSMTLDDLGWHFGNWHHHEYALETARGLRVLGASRAAELFEAAYAQALRHWDRLGEEDWMEWYHGSPLEEAVRSLNREMWELFQEHGHFLSLWVRYARQYPELLNEEAGGGTKGAEPGCGVCCTLEPARLEAGMTARALLMVTMTAFLGGCSSEEGVSVPLQRLASDERPLSYVSGFSTPQRLVVRDPRVWAEVWQQIWLRHHPVPELPAVDFGREMIVVAALGERPSSGYAILVDSAHITSDRLTVSVRQVSPGKDCVLLPATSQPVDVVRLQRTDNSVEFAIRAETHTCG